jgi:uncharacterized protein (TIGR03067 family)
MLPLLTIHATGFLQTPGSPSARNPERDPLLGRWIVIFAKSDGKLDKRRKAAEVTCKDGKITLNLQSGDVEEFGYSRIPGTSPQQIDVFTLEAAHEAAAFKGIYEKEADHLSVCIDFSGKERPTEMTAPAGSRRVLLILKKDTRIIIKSSRKKKKQG